MGRSNSGGLELDVFVDISLENGFQSTEHASECGAVDGEDA